MCVRPAGGLSTKQYSYWISLSSENAMGDPLVGIENKTITANYGMVKKADETALTTSKKLEDGFKRGFIDLKKEVDDFATLAESAVRNAFSNMENALVSFVTTGKANISDLVNAIVQDFAKLAIRQSIT